MRIPSGVTDQYIYFVGVDSTDFTTRETGLSSFTVYRSRNGGAAAAMTTPTINETDTTNMPGVYELLLDEDMTIDSGDDSQEICYHITHAGMAPVTRTVELYRPKITAGNTFGVASDGDISGNLDGTVATVATLTGHTAQTGDSYARLGAPAGASISADIATTDTVLDGLVNKLVVNSTTITGLSSQTVFNLTAGSADDDAYNSCLAVITDASTATQRFVGYVSDYTGSTKTITLLLTPEFTIANGDSIDLLPQPPDLVESMIALLNAVAILPSVADVNAQVADVVNTDTLAELSGVPAANASLSAKVNWLFALARNKMTSTATTISLRNDADGADIGASTQSDDGSTYTRGEFS